MITKSTPYMDDSNAAKLINEELKNGSTPITDLQKWSPHIRPTHRLTWILLGGLPLVVWKPEYMQKVLKGIGEMVEVDEYVEERKRMDVARILVRTNRSLGFQENLWATIDGEEYELTVVEDTSGIGAKMKSYRNSNWFPPSPLSTQPNTPAFPGDETPGGHSGSEDSDGGFADMDDGFCNNLRSSQARRDHWIKSLGRSALDRSTSDTDDVDHSNVVNGKKNSDASYGVVPESHNGHITLNSNDFINEGERRNWDSMHVAKSSENVIGDEGQTGLVYMANKGNSDTGTEGDSEVLRHLEDDHMHRTNTPNCTVTLQSGQQDIKEVLGETGQKQKGPIKSATKVYVRRKEVPLSHGKAHYLKTDRMPSTQGDNIEQQCALVRDLGLSFEGDEIQFKELMLDMENRDNMVAAEMGCKKQIT